MIEGDHPNNSYAWLNLQRRGVPVHFARIPGAVDALAIEPWLRPGTRVLALSHVTSDTGRRCDLVSIGALCRARGIYLVVDAIQSLGIWPLDVHALGISMLASGCHKGLLVPQGLGLLYVDGAIADLQPAYLAAASVANAPADRRVEGMAIELRPAAGRFETGNLSLPQLQGLDAALGLIEQLGPQRIAAHVGALGLRLIGHLDRLGIGLLGARDPQQGSHIHLLDLPGPAIAAHLAQNGVRVSPQRTGIRVSLALFNTVEEVDRLAEILAGLPR
jgi:selenocysteine lyase/cysteine desulfurase